mmetsp:Transcript_22509/g.40030  ORF Transcript_22509/g.40030 Transcript_22509/m.40030 type:complete len:95 (-) Transcript_22509:290-574(-)
MRTHAGMVGWLYTQKLMLAKYLGDCLRAFHLETVSCFASACEFWDLVQLGNVSHNQHITTHTSDTILSVKGLGSFRSKWNDSDGRNGNAHFLVK